MRSSIYAAIRSSNAISPRSNHSEWQPLRARLAEEARPLLDDPELGLAHAPH